MNCMLESGEATPASGMPVIAGPAFFDGLRDELSQLNTSTAEQLLWAAGRLQAIAAKARDISSRSRETATLVAGEDSQRVISSLQGMIADTEKVQRVVSENRNELEAISEQLQQAHMPLFRMGQLPRLLGTVAMLARIETNRIGADVADVSLLAGDISKLALQIRSYVQDISTGADTAATLIATTLHDTGRTESELQKKRTILLNQTRSVLDSLLARVETSSAAARNMDERYSAIRSAIDNVVMSLQVQDIARQRIEHVQDVLEQLESKPEVVQESGTVVALQRSQVAATRDLVLNSISSIVENLTSVAVKVAELASDTEALARQTDSHRGSFASTIEEGLSAVCPIFEQYSESSRTMISAFGHVLSSVTNMTRGVEDLQAIHSRIRLTALNATIETGRLGDDGLALKALGLEVKEIAQAGGEDTSTLLELLTTIGRSAKTTSTETLAEGDGLKGTKGISEARAQLGLLSDAVVRGNQEAAKNLTKVLRAVDALRDDLAAASELSQRKEIIAGAFNKVLTAFDAALERAGYSGEVSSTAINEQDAGLSALYSMDSERQVHRQYYDTQDKSEGSEEQIPDGVPGATTLDEGVELF